MPHFACTKILFQTCGLHWPTVATRVLIRKFSFLSKLLSGTKDTISRRVFSSLAMENIYETSIVQQCRMLEANLGTCVLAKCLSDPEGVPDIIRRDKNTSLTLISRFYYLQLSNVVDQLLQPLVLPLIHHGAVYGTLPWIKELKALASCRRFLRNSAVQAHVSSVRYVTLRCPVTAHAWNMLVQTTQVKWRTFHTIILFPFS